MNKEKNMNKITKFTVLGLILSNLLFAACGQITEINNYSDFQNQLNLNHPTIVKFHHPLCQICKSMKPIDITIMQAFPQINFLQVNVQNTNTFSSQFQNLSTPTYVFFRNGKEVFRKKIQSIFTTQEKSNKIRWFKNMIKAHLHLK